MVSREIWEQAALLASCLGLGGWLMFCYDILRISRVIFPRKYWLVGLEDLLYWVYVSLSAFSLLYRQNDGVLRGYVIGCIFLGMFAYDRLISRNVMRLLQKAAKRIKIKRRKRKPGIKSGDADEEYGKAFPAEKKGQVGKPDSDGRSYFGGAQPGCGGKFKRRGFKGEGSGVSDPGGEPAKADGGGVPKEN